MMMNSNDLLLNSSITFSEFTDLCGNCKLVQEEVLNDILTKNRNTEIGRRYNFDKITTIDDFRKMVPVMEWDDIKEFASESEKGIPDLLFAGKPELFIITSGTTGNCKIIPESKNGLRAKNITTALRVSALLKHFPDAMNGKILPMANSASIGKTECGIPFGTASGITMMNAPDKLRAMIAYPSAILDVEDSDALDYVLMRFAVEQDVRIIICNNAGRLEPLLKVAADNAESILQDIEEGTISEEFKISEQIRDELLSSLSPNPEKAEQLRDAMERSGNFSPGEFWPNLRVINCWLAGSVGNYVKHIKPLFGENVEFMDCGYGATEGKFNIPLELNNPAGPLALYSGFYEFSPLDRGNTFLAAYELEDGESYELYCTTYSGLYRYAMHDIVEVDGFSGTTPNIKFKSKTADFANICGEKMSPDMLRSAFNNAASTAGVNVRHWCVVIEPDSECYNFCFELLENNVQLSDHQLSEFAGLIESELYGDGTLPYPVFRKQQLIKPAKVTLMPCGWHQKLLDMQMKPGISSNQIKLPLVSVYKG
jgi:hypothetical protein